jgi:hypothetical protein
MNKHLKCGLWATVLACISASAMAADTIKIAKVIPYQSAESVGSTNLTQCDWNQKLSQFIVKKSRGKVEAVDTDLAQVQGKTLSLAILTAHTAGGGAISGPKWGRVTGELRDGNELLGNFSIKRVSMQPFTLSVCSPMSKVAEKLSGDIVNWLKNPTIDPDAGKAAEPDAQ